MCLYAIITIAAYSILASAFDFPEILRKPIAERFALFRQNEAVILLTYYLFTFTGLLQMLFSIYLYKINSTNSSNAMVGLAFGVLAGLAQTLGFIRWVVAIPYLTSVAGDTDVSVLEGLLNAYFGMSVGEHLGSLFMAIWLIFISLSMRETKLFDRRLTQMAFFTGLLMIPVAFEPLGSIFSPIAILTIPVFGLAVTWMLLMAYSLFRRKDETIVLKWPVWVIALIFWLVNVVPAFL